MEHFNINICLLSYDDLYHYYKFIYIINHYQLRVTDIIWLNLFVIIRIKCIYSVYNNQFDVLMYLSVCRKNTVK